jgi:hypothetical protein
MAGKVPNYNKGWTPKASSGLQKQAEFLDTTVPQKMTRYDPLTNTTREFTVQRPPTTPEAIASGAFPKLAKPGAVSGKMTTRSSGGPKGGKSRRRNRKQKRTTRKQRR